MSAIQLRTFKDIQDAVREEVKIQSTDTSTINRIKRDINIVYINEVVAANRWTWLRKQVDLQTTPAFFLGKASVVPNSNIVTLTEAPASSKKDYYFSVIGFDEVYKIQSHTAKTNTLVLDRKYMGRVDTEARFWIWTDAVSLPPEMRETQEAWIDFGIDPLQALGFQEFRNSQKLNFKSDGRPELYSTTGYIDPDPFDTITGLPSVATREATGYVRSLTFSATLGADGDTLIEEQDRLRIKSAGNASYNGEITVKAVRTVNVANDTIDYIVGTKRSETATAATSTEVVLVNQEEDVERFRQLLIHPSLLPTKTTIHVEGIVDARPLEADTDEPLVPIEDRAVILYGALLKAWSRERNIEEAQRNSQLFDRKLTQMLSKMEDSYEQPQLEVAESYLRRKRMTNITRRARRS